MYEYESDILVADPEEEIAEKEQGENTNKTSLKNDDLVEVFYNQKQKTEHKPEKKHQQDFSNYNFNHLNKVYKKYDVVQTYVPKKHKKNQSNISFENFVEEQNSYEPQQETFIVEKTEAKPKFKLKQKAKVWLICCSTIAIMLGSLCICNAVNINNLQNQINTTQNGIVDLNKSISTTVKDIGELTSEQEIENNASDLGLSQVDPKNKIEITLNEKNVLEDYKGQTNFFDEICNFIRNLFGG